MLKYLITVTEDLLIAVTLLTLLYALCGMIWKKLGQKILRIGMLLGFLASVAMAVAKNTTSKIATNQWNFYIFILSIATTVLFLVFSFVFAGTKRRRESQKGTLLCCIPVAFLAALIIFYKAPDLIAYPYNFNTGSDGVLSIAFLVRFLGWVAGMLLQLIYSKYLYRSILALDRAGLTLGIAYLCTITYGVRCFGMALSKWVTKAKWLPDLLPTYVKAEYPWAFPMVKLLTNNTMTFRIIISGLTLLLPILLFFRDTKVRQLWENPAQHRRLRAICKRNRHGAETVAICLVLCFVSLTVVKAYINQEVSLSEPETYTIEGDYIYIDISQVDDGHLHRFEYTTDNGIDVRWIVVRKPDSAAYGVGLDACDICGDAGYYERGDQIVCKRCDVVMNTNTIGFSGGCNPIPLDYTISNGQMIFLISDIVAGESNFK